MGWSAVLRLSASCKEHRTLTWARVSLPLTVHSGVALTALRQATNQGECGEQVKSGELGLSRCSVSAISAISSSLPLHCAPPLSLPLFSS